jgi:hypothetical protein
MQSAFFIARITTVVKFWKAWLHTTLTHYLINDTIFVGRGIYFM